MFKVYTIVEKPGSEKGIWLEIGVAGLNRDGSISAKLDALPMNGQVHLREFEPRVGDNPQKQNETPANSWRQKGFKK